MHKILVFPLGKNNFKLKWFESWSKTVLKVAKRTFFRTLPSLQTFTGMYV